MRDSLPEEDDGVHNSCRAGDCEICSLFCFNEIVALERTVLSLALRDFRGGSISIWSEFDVVVVRQRPMSVSQWQSLDKDRPKVFQMSFLRGTGVKQQYARSEVSDECCPKGNANRVTNVGWLESGFASARNPVAGRERRAARYPRYSSSFRVYCEAWRQCRVRSRARVYIKTSRPVHIL